MSALRAVLVALTLLCAPALAHASCPGTPTDCPSPTYNNLTVGGTLTAPIAPVTGANTTPGTGWFKGLAVSDALTHYATVTLEFPTFAAFSAYKPSIVTTALAWAGAPVVAHTAGYFAAGDGGSATYVWASASATAADELFVVTPGGSAGGRWFLQIPSGGTDIRALGVVVDGVTSADVALRAATTACSTYGTVLFFPPGIVKLTGGGGASSTLNACTLKGVGYFPGASLTPSPTLGSMVELTSTTVVPFFLRQDFTVDGINFFWPNQTGAVVYPPLFTGDGNGTHFVLHGNFRNVGIVNAWDGVVTSVYDSGAPCPGTYAATSCPEGWGDVKFENYETFAGHDNFRWSFTGDGVILSDVRVLPGAWLQMGGNGTSVGTMASTSTVFHIAYSGTPGRGVNINANANIVVVGALYGFLVDNNAVMGESQISGTFDSVGTIIDTTAGGAWYGFGVQFTGVTTGCQTPATTWGNPNGGMLPCFNMGSNGLSQLNLTDFHSAGSQGDFITNDSASIIVNSSEALSIGSILATNPSAGEFYALNLNSNHSPNVRVQNSRFGGSIGTTHIHGISSTGSGTPSVVMIQGNHFQGFNDDINVRFPQETIVSGNTSDNTTASGGLKSFNMVGSGNAIVYYGNNWDVPTLPVISSCGTSPSVVGGGPNSGHWTTGSGTVNSCVFTQPFYMFGACTFATSNSISVGDAPSGVPPAHTLSFYVGASPNSNPGMNVFYNCSGQQ